MSGVKTGLDDYLQSGGKISNVPKVSLDDPVFKASGPKLPSGQAFNNDPFPIIHIADVKARPVTYQIEKIWLENSVGFISGQPGTFKTWLAWELAVSIASGTPAFGHFETKRGRVLAFNAEDAPESITRARIQALAAAKGIETAELDLYLFDLPVLTIDDPETQGRIEKTIQAHAPVLIILDPLRNLHSLNEDKASEMSPLLDFLRKIQRLYSCSVLLICHDKKPSKDNSRRESMTRGSNALEGWRDNAIYSDKAESGVRVQIYHRGASAPEPFLFRLSTREESGQLSSAELEFLDEGAMAHEKRIKLIQRIKEALEKNGGPMTREEIRKTTEKQKQACYDAIREMLSNGELKEASEDKGKVLWFSEPDEAVR